ncbi:Gfo/Idh/MocA family oxidoreductase [Oligosphaera ethanolica]|uniref:Dehydrogenase n=1 Tax=Oligosphaera ethanolica TaxID=760260 RepID=A0AAE3VFG7_9BACT|nr:Gfo/Idh/MocA family oxidoreductase [Oligosphaera ethanolica]MDQ0289313.1 putative dehydrogenase [Oligosphaera ethanolica]
MANVSWLLLGAGNIAKIRVGAALRDAAGSELAAICNLDRSRAEALAAQLQLPVAFYSDYDQALDESGAEAVYVATQVPAHVPCSLKAMAAGNTAINKCAPLIRRGGKFLYILQNPR